MEVKKEMAGEEEEIPDDSDGMALCVIDCTPDGIDDWIEIATYDGGRVPREVCQRRTATPAIARCLRMGLLFVLQCHVPRAACRDAPAPD